MLLVGGATCLCLLVLLRVSGKRTLSELNAFDLVVTVALGSILAAVLPPPRWCGPRGWPQRACWSRSSLLVAAVSAWVPGGNAVITARATLLLRDGRVDEAALRRCRVARSELCQAVRASERGGLAQVTAVVLGSDGSVSVVPRGSAGDLSALEDVSR